MGNIFGIVKPMVQAVMKLAAGITPQEVEIEPGTVMNFWVPTNKNGHEKPSVLLIHGFFADGILTWLFQVLALSRRNYAVYVPDLLFFGGSSTDCPHRTTEFQAECLAKGLRKLGVDRCTVVGLSYGGMVGLKLAKQHPNFVESVVISGAVRELTESISDARLEKIGFSSWSDFLMPETAEGLKVLLGIGSRNKTLTRLPNFVYRDFLEVMFNNRKERDELLKALVVPNDELKPYDYSRTIYLLWGENDNIFDMELAQDTKLELGDKVTLLCIKDAGHIVQLDRPNIYNHHLTKILASIYS